MEGIGAAASILAVASAGIQISLKLIAFADQVGTAPKRILDVGTDVSVTAGTLQELGELMAKLPRKKSAELFKPDQVENIKASSTRCKAIFDELKDVLAKASQQLRNVYKSNAKGHYTSPGIKLSRLERMKWPFLQPSMEPLLSALRDAKGTLTLILQVVHLRHAQKTDNLNREEQNDLIRMIAAMRRQQLASSDSDKGGIKALDIGDAEYSDSGNSSDVRTALEAWFITPNTLPDSASRHFYITPIPVSQQQMAQSLETSPQDFDEIASIVDSLSPSESDAILGLLHMGHPSRDDSSIRSISFQNWTGSHDVFGKVVGRKFRLLIEKRVEISISSHTKIGHMAQNIPKLHHHHSRSHPTMYDSFSDVDAIHDTEAHRHSSSPSIPLKEHRRRRPASASRVSPPESSGLSSDEGWKRDQEFEKDKRTKERLLGLAKRVKERSLGLEKLVLETKPKGNLDSKPWTEPRPGSELSDDDLVKSLLTQYTNFQSGEPLVQVFAAPPPISDGNFIIPKRDPRPY